MLNDTHKKFIAMPYTNIDFKCFYNILDTLTINEREEFLEHAARGLNDFAIMSTKDLDATYENFKRRVEYIESIGVIHEMYLIQSILSWVLSWLASKADESIKEKFVSTHRIGLEKAQKEENEYFQNVHKKCIEEFDQKVAKAQILYDTFCTKILLPIMRRSSGSDFQTYE